MQTLHPREGEFLLSNEGGEGGYWEGVPRVERDVFGCEEHGLENKAREQGGEQDETRT